MTPLATWLAPARLFVVTWTVFAAALGAWLADRTWPAPLERAGRLSQVVVDRDGNLLRAFAAADGRWRLPVDVDHVDKRFVAMLLAYEDRRFHSHFGIDPLSVARAGWQFITHGRIVSGASTLTMQTARLLEPDIARGNRLLAKLAQMARAVQLEAHLSKRQILALYLHLAPYGANIEGVRAASLVWFGKEPAKLTTGEAALLVALPQLPEARRPDRFPAAARAARDRVLQRLAGAGVIPAGEARRVIARPLAARRRELPAHAAHLARRLRRANPQSQHLSTTIRLDWQRSLEALARERVEAVGDKASLAMVLADAATGEVLAHVGSPDVYDDARGGYIDMTRRSRSPGSTLKPFIYALGFSDGLIHPETVIDDTPVSIAGYRPRNFDLAYRGQISIREALMTSRNIPAVKVLHAVGPSRLMALLKAAGVDARLPRSATVGLPIALGGIGVDLEGLVRLYAVLARGGLGVDLTFTPAAGSRRPPYPQPPPLRLLPARAVWYVNDILAGMTPPPGASGQHIAYKTGTSYGYRDAWSIGYDGRYVLGVWVGRVDGAPLAGIAGRTTAAPIVFDAFARLHLSPTALPPRPAATLAAAAGKLPVALKRFTLQGDLIRARPGIEAPPRIVYPPHGARIALGSADDKSAPAIPLVMKLQGGRAPFHWLANGKPLDSKAWRRQAYWRVDSTGVSRLTVIDALGRSASVSVVIE